MIDVEEMYLFSINYKATTLIIWSSIWNLSEKMSSFKSRIVHPLQVCPSCILSLDLKKKCFQSSSSYPHHTQKITKASQMFQNKFNLIFTIYRILLFLIVYHSINEYMCH